MARHSRAQPHTRAPRRGAEEWRTLLADFDLLEGTKAEFCRLHGISPGSLSYWRGKYGTADCGTRTQIRSLNFTNQRPLQATPQIDRQGLRMDRPHDHWKTSTFVAGLTLHGMIAPFVHDGPITRRAFEAYVENVLVPELRPGDIVIMDNLSSHKDPGVRQSIDVAGTEIRLLPPCSPDLNPIETVFTKFKTLLLKSAERTVEVPRAAIE